MTAELMINLQVLPEDFRVSRFSPCSGSYSHILIVKDVSLMEGDRR